MSKTMIRGKHVQIELNILNLILKTDLNGYIQYLNKMVFECFILVEILMELFLLQVQGLG